ncbi:transposase [Mesorhizobium sp. M0435]|uniref:transposase n=1 Tax=Mesorhizobium sp. M0435 TaxID=2956944 RepID=UPI003336C93A
MIAAVGDRTCFKNGRQFAAWLGLVPKQRSSGGRARLFGIRRPLFAHADDPWRSRRVGSRRRQTRSAKPLAWQVAATAPSQRRGGSRSPTKNGRIVWSMLSGNAAYQPDLSVKTA